MQAVARETGARADLELYGDTLGPKGSPGATYLGMEQANADAMVRSFPGWRAGLHDPRDLSCPKRSVHNFLPCRSG